MLKSSVGASMLLFGMAGICLLGSVVTNSYNFAYQCCLGAGACFALAIVVLILSIAFHFSIEHNKVSNERERASNIILIRNGEPIQIDPRDIPYYLNNGYSTRELPSGRQGNGSIQLDPASLEALASILDRKNRYLPRGDNEPREDDIRSF